MNKTISAKQLTYSVVAFITASSLLTSNLYYFAKNDSWFSVIIGYAASLLMISIYITLSRRYPGYSLIEINDAVFGKVIGKVFSILYIFFFLSLCYLNTRILGDFVAGSVLPQSPIMVIFTTFVLVCAWAVFKGPLIITRFGFLLTIIVLSAILLNALLLINRTEIENLLPALTLPAKNYLIGAHIVTMLPFCEIMSFMMFVPYLREPQTFGRAMFRGLTIGAVTLLFVVLRDITVLGQFVAFFSMPTFGSIRYIDIGDILTRLEIIYAVVLICLLFYKVSVTYFSTVSGVARLFHIDSHERLVLIFGVLIVVYAAATFTSMAEHTRWLLTAAPTYSTFFLLILPLVTLVTSYVRGMNQEQNGEPVKTAE